MVSIRKKVFKDSLYLINIYYKRAFLKILTALLLLVVVFSLDSCSDENKTRAKHIILFVGDCMHEASKGAASRNIFDSEHGSFFHASDKSFSSPRAHLWGLR